MIVMVMPWGPSCRKKPKQPITNDNVSTQPVSILLTEDKLIYPDHLRADDPTVNAFIDTALHQTLRGEYEEFRLLWSVRGEPLQEDAYRAAWQAVTKIEILDMERLTEETSGDVLYLVGATLDMDTTKLPAGEQPSRRVILMIVREHNDWKLSPPPDMLRNYMMDKLNRAATPATDNP